MPTVLALRHLHFEDLGTLEPRLRDRGFDIRYLDPAVEYINTSDAQDAELLVVLGGPLGAHDEARYPFLAAELELVRQRLASGRPLLGICLGAQLIARALGAAVRPMGHHEIGFSPLALTPAGRESVLAPLAGVPVLHWHGDHFDIPTGATHLAASAACVQQAYALGDAVLALQFHLEADATQIERWLVGHCCELTHARIDPAVLRADATQYGAALEHAAGRVLDAWLDRLAMTSGSST